MPVPVFGHADGFVAQVAELETPDAVDLDWCDRQLGFGVLALERLDQGDAVQDQRPGQVDRVDPAAFAGAVDAGRA